jgi:uncharacterized membrane protein YhhN
MTSIFWLICIVVIAAIVDWIAILRKWPRAKYITKPLVILLLIAWLFLFTELKGETILFGLALIFSVVGDIWLMMPGSYFLLGLVSFFLAHCAYIVAFTPSLPSSLWFLIISLVVLAGSSSIFFTQILAGIRRTRGARRLRILSGLYCLILALMFVSALSTLFRPEWSTQQAGMAALGGLFFFASDTLLSYDRFVKPIRYGRLLVRITYHLGQIMIIAGAALHIAGISTI